MDHAKHHLLFGDANLPPEYDPDREPDRERLLVICDEYGPEELTAASAVATEIAEETPPQVWATARRLLGLGLDRREVYDELVFAWSHADRTAEAEKKPFDVEAYVRSLGWLPLPDDSVAEVALVEAARAVPGLAVGDAFRLAMQDLGRDAGDELAEVALGEVVDVVVSDDTRGPLILLSDDRLVHVGDLVAGSVFTHRLTPEERSTGHLPTFELIGINRLAPLRLEEREVDVIAIDERAEHLSLQGPEGWLQGFPAGALIGVRVDESGTVTVSAVAEPAADPDLVDRLRTVYEAEIEDAELPATLTEVALALLVDDPHAFAEPRLPLGELCTAAGLERRGSEVAHNPSYWANADRLRGIGRTLIAFDADNDRNAALRAIDAALDPRLSPAVLREVLDGLAEPGLAAFVADELTAASDARGIDAQAFARRLVQAARRPEQVVVASWLAAVAEERRGGSALAGEEFIRAAVDADPGWPPAIDWAGWYAYDRGDAAGAARWWRALKEPPVDLVVATAFARRPQRELGRNDPCWCGSGRKYKACHLGRPELPALPDRLTWLWRKALAYLERRGNEVADDLLHHAHLLAGGVHDDAKTEEAFSDPLVADVVLHERGWFERFLRERGPLLPNDEMVLATAWMAVPRTVFEVAAVAPGESVTLKDVRTGLELTVPDERFGDDRFERARSGALVCGRAVFDGEGHQLIGGLFAVQPGTEDVVLELCDARAGEELCAYVATVG